MENNNADKLAILEEEAKQLGNDIAGIKAQLTAAIESKKHFDAPINVEWFKKAKFAQKMKEYELGVLHDQIKKLKVALLEEEHAKNREEKLKRHNKIREEKIKQQKEFEHCFVDVARMELSEEQFSKLISKAKELQKYRVGGLYLKEVK